MRRFEPAEFETARRIGHRARGTLAVHISRIHSLAAEQIAAARHITKRAVIEGLIEELVAREQAQCQAEPDS